MSRPQTPLAPEPRVEEQSGGPPSPPGVSSSCPPSPCGASSSEPPSPHGVSSSCPLSPPGGSSPGPSPNPWDSSPGTPEPPGVSSSCSPSPPGVSSSNRSSYHGGNNRGPPPPPPGVSSPGHPPPPGVTSPGPLPPPGVSSSCTPPPPPGVSSPGPPPPPGVSSSCHPSPPGVSSSCPTSIGPGPPDLPGDSLEQQLAVCKSQVQRLEQLLCRSQRLCRSTDSYNRDLRQQVEQLSREIHERKRETTKTDAEVQTEDYAAWSQSDYYYYSHQNYYQSNDVQVNAVPADHNIEGSTPVAAEQYEADTSAQASIGTVENGQNGLDHDAGFVQRSEKAEGPSLAESLRETAEAAVSQTGFTYDENTGLYYDHSTGFYYDSENQLYYDANTGIYYYCDADSGRYLFHSRIDLQAQQVAATQPSKEKKVKRKRRTEYQGTNTEEQMTSASSTEKEAANKKKVKMETDITERTIKKEIISTSENGNSRHSEYNAEAIASVDDSDSEKTNSEPEDGEITDSDIGDDSSKETESSDSCTDSEDSENEETEHIWPPCIRVIVIRSPVLETGTLFIITAVKHATIGREKDMEHTIQIPEAGVSKFHAQVYFDHDLKSYMLVDQGSQNGTIINGNQILQPKIKCEPYVLEHGDEVKFGETVLSFHVHPGSETCGGCEPGQVRAHLRLNKKEESSACPIVSKEEKEILRRKELKQIRVKYGLQNCDYEENQAVKNPKYKDRAGNRRQTVGSEGSFQRDDAPASVHVEINDTNKGHRMLKKMGWKKGEGLGKRGGGIKDPIQLQIRQKKAGLGAGVAASIEDVPIKSKSSQNWEKARERFAENFQDVKLKEVPKATPWVKGELE